MGLLARLRAFTSRKQMEGSNRGPFTLFGEFGNPFPITPITDGWQQNLGTVTQRNLIVAAIRNAYAFSLASSGIDHIRHAENGGIEVMTKTVAYRVLKYPNAYQNQIDFISMIVSCLIYHGNFYAYVVRNDRNEIAELHPVPPNRQRAFVDDTGALWYDMGGNFPEMRSSPDSYLPAREVLHVKLSSHRSLLEGESPIADAGYAIALNAAVGHGLNAFHHNMARPSGILSTDIPLTKDQMKALREAFDEQAQGFKQGRVPILGGGLKWEPMGITAADSHVIETYKLTVLDLCRLFRIPPQVLGLDVVGAASSPEVLFNTWRATGLLFFAEAIERALERTFRMGPGDGAEARLRDDEFRFDFNNLTRADTKATIEGLATGVQNGIYSPNEARAKLGLPAVPHGESPRVQAQNVRLEDAMPAPSAPAAPVAPAAPQAAEEPEDEDMDDDTAKAVAVAMIAKAVRNA
jgi:HK97 family phage portal protein